MKLNKEQKQKLVLGAMLVIGVIYAYFEFLLGPLRGAEQAAIYSANELEPKIATSVAQITKVANLKAKQPDAHRYMAQIKAMIPEGSPIAWFPPRLVEFFKKHGVDKVAARLNNETVEKELVGFRRLNWGVEAPNVDFIKFAAALSALENAEPLIEVQSFEAEAGRENVGVQRVAKILNNLMNL
jgi:hypothetical protein